MNEHQDKYTLVIGLEIHAQLNTKSKIYCADENSFGSDPNTNLGVITLAHPGTLPLLNKVVLEDAIKMGLACGSTISRFNIFDRKNYFYPDLPKGYQLTQDRTPICVRGEVVIKKKGGERTIALNRIHIEEDAGKSIHVDGETYTRLDFNRSGVPLIEIVTEPVLHSSEEASTLLTEVRRLVRYLEICDGNMEEGSMRCDANVSVMPKGSTVLGKKVEIKNMNSMRNVQRAIDHEAQRQMAELDKGNTIISETRLFDVPSGKTFSMRTKEELNDYRYFPDPDLSPVLVSDEWLAAIEASMPSLPQALIKKFISHYQLPEYDARVLTDTRELANYFEEVCAYTNNYKAVSNWVMGPVKSFLNENAPMVAIPVSPKRLADLIGIIEDGKLNFSIASKVVFPELINDNETDILEIVNRLNVVQESNQDTLVPIIDAVLNEFPAKVAEFKRGKKGIITMFMGEVMKRSKGKADPKRTNELLAKRLSEV